MKQPSRTARALAWLQADDTRTQHEAARLHGITQPALSAALARAGKGRPSPQVARERDACAVLAEVMGAPDVAALIRARGAP